MREKINIGEYGHVYLRGVDKKDIFLEQSDYERFLKLLKYCNKKNSLSFSVLLRRKKEKIDEALSDITEDLNNVIIATLMPNHFHILIRCIGDYSVGKHMHKVLDSYARYFNKKYAKKGYRFESKYQYRKIENEHDLQNTIDYIYNNPAKLLDKEYKHIDLLNGKYKLSKKQSDFVKKYPHTYKGPTFAEYRRRFNLEY